MGGGLEVTERQRVPTGTAWAKTVGYSRAVRVGDQVYVSGTIAVQDDASVGPVGDPYGQARRCLEIIVEALAEAGAGVEEVVRTRMYVTSVNQWSEIGRAHGEFFSDVQPATTLVEVAGLIDPDALVEIEAMAVIGSG